MIDKKLGANYLKNGDCQFRVWAPFTEIVELLFIHPENKIIKMEKDLKGYHSVVIHDVPSGSLYYYRLDGEKNFPDPASRSQPKGVFGPSEVINRVINPKDQNWAGIPLKDYIIYELHVGSFTTEGTFQAIIPYLDELKRIGITAIELMPVSQFSGERNWGYDGVFPFAVQNTYGGPEGLRDLVNTCHQKGLAVILDVVYNHVGPEGNNFEFYGPYFTDRYLTPWGKAMNFDGAYSDEVRSYFVENALYWIDEFHIDALRLDALHAILDMSARPFLLELSQAINKFREDSNECIYLFGESDANDRRVILQAEANGLGMDAQWSDDFHHSLHALLTGEQDGYYKDFGQIHHLVKAYRDGFVYSGQYSQFRLRKHGSSSTDIPAERFVVCSQNHDQVGNRMLGERLTQMVSFEEIKQAAAVVLLSPFIPLIFMGQEYDDPAPFQYFINHSDPKLIEAVRQGRRKEFADFHQEKLVPDPQNNKSFLITKLDHSLKEKYPNKILVEYFTELLRLRKEIPALANLSKETMEVMGNEESRHLFIRRWKERNEIFFVINFSDCERYLPLPISSGIWKKQLSSADERWLGRGSKLPEDISSNGKTLLNIQPHSCALYSKTTQEI